MKFVCDRCQTRYSIADEKVRRKILRIRCKTCGNVIVVEGEQGAQTGSALGRRPGADSAREAPAGAEAKPAPASGPKLPPVRAAAVAPPPPPAVPPPPPPAEDELGGRVEWFVAIHGAQSGPFSRTEAAKWILAAEPGKTVHVWKEGMPKWKPSSEVSVIAREISMLRRKPGSRPKGAPLPPPPPPPPSPPPATDSAWGPLPRTKPEGPAEPPTPQLFPGQPLTPAPATPLDDQDTPTDPGRRVFTDTTTKKGKDLQDLGRLLEQDTFGEATTEGGKSPRGRSALAPGPMAPEKAGPALPALPSVIGVKPIEKTAPPSRPMPPVGARAMEKTPPPSHPLPPVGAKPPAGAKPMAKIAPTSYPMPPVGARAMEKTPLPLHPLPPVGSKALERTGTAPSPMPPAGARAMQKTPPPSHSLPPVGAKAVDKSGPPTSPSPPLSTMTPAAAASAISVPITIEPEASPAPDVDGWLKVMAAVSVSVPAAELQHPAPAPSQERVMAGFMPSFAASSVGQQSAPVLTPAAASAAGQVSPPAASLWAGPGARLATMVHQHRGLTYVVAAAGLVLLVILLVVFSLRGDGSKAPELVNPQAATSASPAKPEPPKVEEPKPEAAKAPEVKPTTQARPASGGRGRHRAGKSERVAAPEPAPAAPPSRLPNPFLDAQNVSQARISAVVRSKSNQASIKSCYERALKMDNRITSGRIDVTVSVGTSGHVQRVVINAPPSFIMVEPCIKNAVKRWVFPSSSEEYATNFPLIMQGGM